MGKKHAAWKTLLREEIISTPWMSLYHDQFEMPNGQKGNYFYMHTHGSALTIPITDEGHVLLVKQYRYLTGNTSIELPCGGIKEGQSEEEQRCCDVVRELLAAAWTDPSSTAVSSPSSSAGRSQ